MSSPGAMHISRDALFPLSVDTSPPDAGATEYLHDPSVRLLVDFFRNKGLAALKQEDRQEDWYPDWIEYQAEHKLYASVLSPEQYSSLGCRFNLLRLTRFLEVFAYFSPAHAYSLHVTFLGLFPILMSANESLKMEAVAALERGGLFAFGVSEKAHGSDLLANEFTIRPAGPAGWLADGSKSYIGNANAAFIISVLAKKADGESSGPHKRTPFVFFALRPNQTQAFWRVRKMRTLGVRTAFVGEFEVRGYSLPESDIISQGREAWDAVFGTVNLGKLFLGFGTLGICEHAFAEAYAYMHRRFLYGKPVTEMPHIRAALAQAYARLTAMKLYAYRALDYLQASGDNDRRYLLFNAVQKARVTTEGVKVIGLLSECLGAHGFEAETYFESALREAQLVPGLEGSTHINFRLTAQFIGPYFAASGRAPPSPASLIFSGVDADENPYLTAARDRKALSVRFAHFLNAYKPLLSVPSVRAFVRQVRAFRRFAAESVSDPGPGAEIGVVIATGNCFSVIAYAQLVAENCHVAEVASEIVSVIFQVMTEDLTAAAIKLAAMYPAGSAQRTLLKGVVRVPETNATDWAFVAASIETRFGQPLLGIHIRA